MNVLKTEPFMIESPVASTIKPEPRTAVTSPYPEPTRSHHYQESQPISELGSGASLFSSDTIPTLHTAPPVNGSACDLAEISMVIDQKIPKKSDPSTSHNSASATKDEGFEGEPPQHHQHPQDATTPLTDDRSAGFQISNIADSELSAPAEASKNSPNKNSLFTADDFPAMYSAYLGEFHHTLHCLKSFDDHITAFMSPPRHRGSSFDAYMFLCASLTLGGPTQSICWADLTRKMGYDTRNSSVAGRVKAWTEKNHIFDFFQFILGGIDNARNVRPYWGATVSAPTATLTEPSTSTTAGLPLRVDGRGSKRAKVVHEGDRHSESKSESGGISRSSPSLEVRADDPPTQTYRKPSPTPPPEEPPSVKVSRDNILRLYEVFLYEFHGDSCQEFDCKLGFEGERDRRDRISAVAAGIVLDHVGKAALPPGQVDKSCDIYTIFSAVLELGGFSNMTSWSSLMRRVGLDPSFSNVSTRLKHWLSKHHFFAFFDFLLGSKKLFDPYSPEFLASLKRKPKSLFQRRPRAKRRRLRDTIAQVQDPDESKENGVISARNFSKFLRAYHQDPVAGPDNVPGCSMTTAEHLDRYMFPPICKKIPTDKMTIFNELKKAGGSKKVESWSAVSRACGFETRNSNISGRLKTWVVSNHVDAFYDWQLGCKHPFLERVPKEVESSDSDSDASDASGSGGSVSSAVDYTRSRDRHMALFATSDSDGARKRQKDSPLSSDSDDDAMNGDREEHSRGNDRDAKRVKLERNSLPAQYTPITSAPVYVPVQTLLGPPALAHIRDIQPSIQRSASPSVSSSPIDPFTTTRASQSSVPSIHHSEIVPGSRVAQEYHSSFSPSLFNSYPPSGQGLPTPGVAFANPSGRYNPPASVTSPSMSGAAAYVSVMTSLPSGSSSALRPGPGGATA
ncbi:hypothetical protein DFJ73DRAFT_519605 [Zopfochytrium polystomum]|nr:hypothetical protein DFJ73DRAFT_519605 [Zopfochytrium polystomum]